MWRHRLTLVLESWKGTPYRNGGSRAKGPGGGANCIHFLAGVYDELHGTTTVVPLAPPDTVFHNPKETARVVRALLESWPNEPIATMPRIDLEPGDCVVVQNGKGQGHVLIASADPYKLWHCDFPDGVGVTSLGACGRVLAIYRPLGKERWV
jgi:cell wall-associated NlpC family hydrolase